mgnify:CR=1 FL=1
MALGGNKDSKTTQLKTANARLDAAMGRLEKALAAQNTGAGDPEVATLRAENEKLSGLNKITGERLDSAINRLKAVLKEV